MIYEKLTKIQNELKVSKSKYNSFNNFYYRSVEDIQHSIKPLLLKYSCSLYLYDIVECINGMNYVKAVVRLVDIEDSSYVEVYGYAREVLEKKGMDVAQITGSCSSYARKYALGGLFLLDDQPDADSYDNTKDSHSNKMGKVITKVVLEEGGSNWERVVNALRSGYSIEDIKKKYILGKDIEEKLKKVIGS